MIKQDCCNYVITYVLINPIFYFCKINQFNVRNRTCLNVQLINKELQGLLGRIEIYCFFFVSLNCPTGLSQTPSFVFVGKQCLPYQWNFIIKCVAGLLESSSYVFEGSYVSIQISGSKGTRLPTIIWEPMILWDRGQTSILITWWKVISSPMDIWNTRGVTRFLTCFFFACLILLLGKGFPLVPTRCHYSPVPGVLIQIVTPCFLRPAS